MIWTIALITNVTKSFFCDILVTERYNPQSIDFLFFNITTKFTSYYYTITQIKLINDYWPLCQCSNLIVQWLYKEQFEETNGAIRIRISKNTQHNGEKKKYKRKNNNLQDIHIKQKFE
jgi:hypothetical protein